MNVELLPGKVYLEMFIIQSKKGRGMVHSGQQAQGHMVAQAARGAHEHVERVTRMFLRLKVATHGGGGDPERPPG